MMRHEPTGFQSHMNTLTVDTSLQQSLGALSGITEVRATDGRLIGYFSPCDADRARLYAEAASHFDPEEIRTRRSSGEMGRRLADVIASLNEQAD